MTLFSAARGLWWVASEVVDAAKRLCEFTLDGADVLADYEAGVECLEAQDDCGLGHNPSSSAAPGFSRPVDAADNGPGVTPPSSTPGPPPSLNWCAAEMRQVAGLLLTTGLPMARGYANDLRAAAATHSATLGQDPASVHDRTMRQRHNEDKREMP